jgi:hypothetical protein
VVILGIFQFPFNFGIFVANSSYLYQINWAFLRESTLIEERHAIDKKNVGDGRVIIVGY